jgi:3-deoxy-D-manno-octulosonic-acid transferase
MEAAALGSALLHGPRVGDYGPVFDRLGAARAARGVSGVTDLGEALADLLSPDRAARLAQAAWAVASDGADVTDRVVTLLRDLTKTAT